MINIDRCCMHKATLVHCNECGKFFYLYECPKESGADESGADWST